MSNTYPQDILALKKAASEFAIRSLAIELYKAIEHKAKREGNVDGLAELNFIEIELVVQHELARL